MAVTPICSDADLAARYGASNIAIMADLDADADATKIAARKLLARTRMTARVYDRLRSSGLGFVLPLTTVPDTLVDATVKLSGYWLSTANGSTNSDKDGNPITAYYSDRQDALQTLEEIAAGRLKLELDL